LLGRHFSEPVAPGHEDPNQHAHAHSHHELTAVPLGVAFAFRSFVAERWAGLAVVAAIFISACVAGVEAIQRLIHPSAPTHLGALAAAGATGYVGNWIAAQIRTRAGHRLDSPALVADGNHARADA